MEEPPAEEAQVEESAADTPAPPAADTGDMSELAKKNANPSWE